MNKVRPPPPAPTLPPQAHNSFRQQSSFEIVQDKDDTGDDAFHFVSYVCHEGKAGGAFWDVS